MGGILNGGTDKEITIYWSKVAQHHFSTALDVLADMLLNSTFDPKEMEFFGKVNFLKAGIQYSTAVNTVSPRYSKEIQTPEFGCGLDGLLRERSSALYGILNGVDYSSWDPSLDKLISAQFTPSDLEGKKECKKELLRLFQLPSQASDVPVAGMVSRLASQKGLDILCESL